MRQLIITFALFCTFLSGTHPAEAEDFQLKREGGVHVLPVEVNGSITLKFTLDSGASDVVIPLDVFSTLSRTGTITSTDMMESGTYQLADGTLHKARRFRIRSLKIGGLEVKNVTASIAPTGGTLLLGQSFLSRLPAWSIDNQRERLIVGDSASGGGGGNAPSTAQQGESYAKRVNSWVACAQPLMAKAEASLKYEDQLAIQYPRFGLLWTQWKNLSTRCAATMRSNGNDSDVSGCDTESVKRARATLVDRVLATAEPEAVRGFNLAENASQQANSEMDRKCGNLPKEWS